VPVLLGRFDGMGFPVSKILGFAMVVVATLALAGCGGLLPKTSSLRATQSLKESAVERLKAIGSSPGQAMLIRIFKQSNVFEVW
jgi:hypothetical protein